MHISRINAGIMMIGISIFLLLIPSLIEDPDAPMSVAGRALVNNSLFIATVTFMVVGIYFAFFSKPCPACGEQIRRSAKDCKYCGRVFKKSRNA